MQTLSIYNKPIILATPEENISEALTSYTVLENLQPTDIPQQLNRLKQQEIEALYISSSDPSSLFNAILQHFQHWKAAGGLVVNPAKEILLMFRKGKWDLPKGKMESKESPEETALREVSEETGLQHIRIEKKLTETWHSYPLSVYNIPPSEADPRDILKQTFWYQMAFTGSELTVPQIEEDIMDIQWIKPEHIEKYTGYSYPNLKQVFRAAGYL